MGFFQWLFSTAEFMPHKMCYEDNPSVIRLHVISDALIALAYYSIPITLLYFVRKRKDLVFDWMFLCFAAFIVACGTTHLMEILNIWYPTYWLSGFLKAVTAALSVVTAILLIRLVPLALVLPSPAQLRKSNEALEREVQERKQSADRIEVLNAELQRQKAQLEAANQELESFGYSVSHDLRAPLRHIDGYVDLLREKADALGEEGGRYMQVISDSARQMTTLIDHLLAFSRLGREALKPAWIETTALVEQARAELAPEMQGRKIAWKIAPLPRVHADPSLLKLVWVNLMSNAIKYTRKREQAEISIGCKENPGEYEFFIKDNGAGFDMQYTDKLFGIFQRLHFKEEFEGTGVGLANAQRIISRHGGQMRAEGRENAGATFYFTLPKATVA